LNRKVEIDHRLHDVQERLFSIVSSTSDLVAILDRDAECTVYLNPAGRAMLGIDEHEDVTRINLKQCFSSDKAKDEFERRIKQAEADGRWTGECQLTGRNNQSIPVELQLLAHRSENGHVTWLSVIASDSTAMMQLRQAQKMEAVGRLAAGIAHEINTPAQYVGDNTQFLKESFRGMRGVIEAYRALAHAARSGAVSGELLERVEQAEADGDLAYLMEQIPSALEETIEGINRITKIVRAMKEFSHPGKSEKCPTDINKAIETTVTVARNEWRYVAEMTLNLDPQLPLVPCLVSEFNQAILNLVVNAAHAIGDVVKKQSGAKGSVCITTRRVGNDIEVRVADTGSGIPAEVRPRIFEPFFTTNPMGEGTGQGLAFVYHSVVEKHGGKIFFETEPGKGTTFVLSLPLGAQVSEKR
jgi:signal transduction histidine kinase